MNTIYLNGEFLPIDQAYISVLDRGFLFGDGVYEVIPVFDGHLFRAEEHLTRLQNSLRAVDIDLTIDTTAWRVIFKKLIAQHAAGDQSIYLQITRGAMAERDHSYTKNLVPTIFAMTTPVHYRSYEELQQGGKAITLNDTRWQHCYIKAITLLPNVLAYQTALHQQQQEAILIRDGFAIEATSSNLFLVKENTIITPPLTPFMLGGITRDLIIELATSHHFSLVEKWISQQELYSADELWLTSSKKEIFPIIELDGQKIGQGKAGPLWEQMIQCYYAYKKRVQQGEFNG